MRKRFGAEQQKSPALQAVLAEQPPTRGKLDISLERSFHSADASNVEESTSSETEKS